MPVTHVDPPGGYLGNALEVDTARVTISDIKANHHHPAWLIAQWTNMDGSGWVIPVSRTELLGNTRSRTKYSFQYCDQIRFVVSSRKPGGRGIVTLQYSSDGGSLWGSLDGAGGPNVNVSKYGVLDSGWLNLSATVKALGAADVLLRVTGEAGVVGVASFMGWIGAYVR